MSSVSIMETFDSARQALVDMLDRLEELWQQWRGESDEVLKNRLIEEIDEVGIKMLDAYRIAKALNGGKFF
jgi:hypothetical protein